MKRFILFAVILILCLRGKAQNWVAPGGGYYNNNLYYSLYADNLHNCLYNFAGDTNVLANSHWYNWYPNTNLLRGLSGFLITYSDHKHYTFHRYYENNDVSKPRSALIRWTNGSDLDTVKVFQGTYGMCCENQINNKFYVTVVHDTANYASYLAEFTGSDFQNMIFDTIWQGHHYMGIRQTINYNNEIYAIGDPGGGFSGLNKIIVYRNGVWQPLPPWKGVDNGVIVKMLVYNNRLYFIGGFWKQENPTIPGNSVMAWDGTRWDDLNGGIENYQLYLNGGVNDAVVCNNKIYFVGPFDHAGGMLANKIVTWNDTSWCTIGGDLDSCYTISQVECFKDTVYIEGNLANVHGVNLGSIGKLMNLNYADSCKLIATGIRENKKPLSGIQISPNPVSSILKISFKSNDVFDISICAVTGQVLFKQKEIRAGQEVDVGFLPAGIYFLTVKNETGQKAFKFVKD